MLKIRIASVLWSAALASSALMAQAPPNAPARGPAPGEVEVDPINCWWRTSKGAVELGERFTLTLTCGVVETNRNKVLVDPNQLDATALPLTPFEVVAGTRHEDVLAPPWRYFQYDYTVRIIGNGFFGQDLDIPRLTVKYTMRSSTGDNEGREQTYVLPALPMRILSLVPPKTADIRDASRETFADMEARRQRATEELVAAAVAFGFVVVLLALALARMVGQSRKRKPAAVRALPPATLLGACLGAIRRLRSDVAHDGWTADRTARALAVLRVAAAVALGRTVAQSVVDTDTPAREGQVLLQRGIIRSRRAMISAATSPESIERRLATTATRRRASTLTATLEQLREPLHVFSSTRYGRREELNTADLDAALENGEKAIRRMRLMSLWPMRMRGAAVAAWAVVWLR
jgi:hypothetical protein